MPRKHRILALVFHEFENLDLFGPMGAIIPGSDYYTLELVNVHNLPSPNGLESSIKNGIGITPNMTLTQALEDTKPFSTLFIPGGLSMMHFLEDAILLEKIGQLVLRASTVFTVCTGSLILAATGVLDGRGATCNKQLFDEVTPKYPHVIWKKKARWVQDRKYLTASGVTAGIDAGFAFVARTYLAPEDRDDRPEIIAEGQADNESFPRNYDSEKAIKYARHVARMVEHCWNEDPGNDPFAVTSA
ncbi:DJ-1_PfpI domain-containing protein [Penicillium ucsense]|uniref:DJ-1_PfpI domain-containing protein n=1 Tax=Penicillium ucsense TaxID=2839758 RepID=A0A8J8W613_9EURO|nr:DJ-1_PfpI domain-containing protein [Penicillium ucsense]KAF7733908.1 DJ-1_PfpI domain-containing protein [Penicillium ucsense]